MELSSHEAKQLELRRRREKEARVREGGRRARDLDQGRRTEDYHAVRRPLPSPGSEPPPPWHTTLAPETKSQREARLREDQKRVEERDEAVARQMLSEKRRAREAEGAKGAQPATLRALGGAAPKSAPREGQAERRESTPGRRAEEGWGDADGRLEKRARSKSQGKQSHERSESKPAHRADGGGAHISDTKPRTEGQAKRSESKQFHRTEKAGGDTKAAKRARGEVQGNRGEAQGESSREAAGDSTPARNTDRANTGPEGAKRARRTGHTDASQVARSHTTPAPRTNKADAEAEGTKRPRRERQEKPGQETKGKPPPGAHGTPPPPWRSESAPSQRGTDRANTSKSVGNKVESSSSSTTSPATSSPTASASTSDDESPGVTYMW